MKKVLGILMSITLMITIFSRCGENKSSETGVAKKDTMLVETGGMKNGGFENQVKWGEHLVTIAGCNDCHTPKKMTAMGPVPDSTLTLSGHPAKMPAPDIDRKMVESKGLAVTNDLTSWVGPWGISFAANITSDSTGIGSWTEDQFLLCLRQGKWKGLAASRSLLPPMPWQDFRQMSDDELKAIFAYLKSTKPIVNIEPPVQPPVNAPHP